MQEKTAKIIVPQDSKDLEIDLPIYQATMGQNVIAVSSLAKHNLFTFDPGFRATAACNSKITYIDGEEGLLLHRGYPVSELANKVSFLELAYLLLHGELANNSVQQEFVQRIKNKQKVSKCLTNITKSFAFNAHPMAMLCSLSSAFAAEQEVNLSDPKSRVEAIEVMLANMPILAAMCHRHSQQLEFIPPRQDLDYTANFLYMLNGKEHSASITKAMDLIFILHADHEQNASTSTVRLAGSTLTHPYAAVAAGIAALWGPSHGGANEAVLNMLAEIGDPNNVTAFIDKVKDKNNSAKLMGFGHRVYKNFDPRASIIKQTCHSLLKELKIDTPLLNIAMQLEKIALEDEYFMQRKLYPNVDFYSGIVLQALNIPTSLFTVIFALARTSGWLAQWHEMLSEDNLSIGRPRQLYLGKTTRQIQEQG